MKKRKVLRSRAGSTLSTHGDSEYSSLKIKLPVPSVLLPRKQSFVLTQLTTQQNQKPLQPVSRNKPSLVKPKTMRTLKLRKDQMVQASGLLSPRTKTGLESEPALPKASFTSKFRLKKATQLFSLPQSPTPLLKTQQTSFVATRTQAKNSPVKTGSTKPESKHRQLSKSPTGAVISSPDSKRLKRGLRPRTSVGIATMQRTLTSSMQNYEEKLLRHSAESRHEMTGSLELEEEPKTQKSKKSRLSISSLSSDFSGDSDFFNQQALPT